MALSIAKLQRWGRRSLEMDEKFLPTLYWACAYLSILGLKLIYVSKTGPRCVDIVSNTWSRYACVLTTILWYYDLRQKYIKQSVNVNSLYYMIKLHAYKLSESPLVTPWFYGGQDLIEIYRLT